MGGGPRLQENEGKHDDSDNGNDDNDDVRRGRRWYEYGTVTMVAKTVTTMETILETTVATTVATTAKTSRNGADEDKVDGNISDS